MSNKLIDVFCRLGHLMLVTPLLNDMVTHLKEVQYSNCMRIKVMSGLLIIRQICLLLGF